MKSAQPRKFLPIGKLPLEHLRSLLQCQPRQNPRLVIGPQIGEDAAVIDAGDRYLVVTTGPITFATDQIGRYAVHVNANDVAVLGARPLWFFLVMLLPESGTTPEFVRRSRLMYVPRARNDRPILVGLRLALCGRPASQIVSISGNTGMCSRSSRMGPWSRSCPQFVTRSYEPSKAVRPGQFQLRSTMNSRIACRPLMYWPTVDISMRIPIGMWRPSDT
jgi:AIR synthase related protein, N-terminal domain